MRDGPAVAAAARALDALGRAVLRRRLERSDLPAAAMPPAAVVDPLPSAFAAAPNMDTAIAAATTAVAAAAAPPAAAAPSSQGQGGPSADAVLDVAWAGAVAQDLLAALFRGAALEQSAVRTLRAALDASDRHADLVSELLELLASDLALKEDVELEALRVWVVASDEAKDVLCAMVTQWTAMVTQWTAENSTRVKSLELELIEKRRLCRSNAVGKFVASIPASSAVPASKFRLFFWLLERRLWDRFAAALRDAENPALLAAQTLRADADGHAAAAAAAAPVDATDTAGTAGDKAQCAAAARAGPSLLPGAGDGLFAARALPAGTFVAFYPGEWRPAPEAAAWWAALPPHSPAAAYTAALQVFGRTGK
jgi:hypothetical protein